MAYDGFYSGLSTRGSANDILNEAIRVKNLAELAATEADNSADAAEGFANYAMDRANDAAESANEAAQSAAEAKEAKGFAKSTFGRYVGVLSVPPTVRADGSPLQFGDEYDNLVDKLRYKWIGTAWSALNSSSTQLATALSLPTGSENVGFLQAGISPVPRTVLSKERDIVSVLDFAAVGDGTTDSTSAFLLAGPGAYVPRGTYVVDTKQVQIHKYVGPGVILSGGQLINLTPVLLDGAVGLKLGASPRFGFNSSGPDAQIYPSAGNATQGITLVLHNGVKKLIISQRVGGASWAPDEMVRFSEWSWTGDGSDLSVVSFSEPLRVGHGADLSSIVEGGKIYLYTTAGNDGSFDGGSSKGGKGFSKVEWKGAATTQEDVQNFRVFGDPNDGSTYPWPQRASVCASNDGKYIILVATSFVGTGRFFFVYDRAEVESKGLDSRSVRPILGPVPFERAPGESGSTLQGMTSDGKHVYTVWGTGAVRSSKSIQIYDMAGRLRRTIPYGAAGGLYTEDELLGLTEKGIPVSFEPEGITLYGDKLLTLSVDSWKAPRDVVPFEGFNWASINTTATSGREPTNRAGWVITKLPATFASYDPSVAYVAGVYLRRNKRVMVLDIDDENSLPQPMVDAPTGTMKEYYAGTDIAYNAENGSFTIAKFYEALGTYKKFAEFNYNNTLNLFSTATGTDNTRWVSMKSQWDSSMYGMQLRSSGGNAAGGANIDMHAVDCPVQPGELTLSSADTAVVRLRNGSVTAATANGQRFAFFVDTEVRSTTDKVVRLGGVTNNWRAVHSQEYCVDVSTCRIMSGFGDPEGNSQYASSPGSLYLRRDPAATAWLYVKQSGTGNTGWVAK